MRDDELDRPNGNNNTDDDLYEYQEIRVDRGQEPLRVDKFLMNRMQNVSRSRVQNAIRSGNVLVDGGEVKPNFKIKPGHFIKVLVPKPPGEGVRLVPQDIPLDILYEDDHLLIVNKPAGMVVHPGVGNRTGTLVNALAYHFGSDLPVMPGNFMDRIGLVHRIDKFTSGLLVVAKNEYAMSHLARQFFNHTIERTYYALVWGDVEEDQGTVNAHVGRDRRYPERFTTYPEGDYGKWAVTHYEVIERLHYVTLIKCNLETGRTHQIRVHMKSLGHPLFNDVKYGGNEIVKGMVYSKYKLFVDRMFIALPRQGLHAKSLGFVHPHTGEFMQFDSELPEDMHGALEGWRRYVEGRKSATRKLP